MKKQTYGPSGTAVVRSTRLPEWRKSSHSNPQGACVEIAEPAGGRILFRDSKVCEGPVMGVSRPVAAAFTAAVARGDL